jgi:acetyltransferase-like isoleucine patch superfamily enzyme
MWKKILRKYLIKTGRFKRLYIKLCSPSGYEYAEYQKKWGRYFKIGDDCAIWPYTNVTDPEYTSIGNNVMLTACTLLGHDGSIAVLNKAYNKRLDRVGKIDIKDNVFIGHGAIVLPGVTINSNVIVAAGSVVTKDVTENTIVAGVPAKPIGKVSDLVKKLEKQTQSLPWAHLIEKRQGCFDSDMEPELKRFRVQYFFGHN